VLEALSAQSLMVGFGCPVAQLVASPPLGEAMVAELLTSGEGPEGCLEIGWADNARAIKLTNSMRDHVRARAAAVETQRVHRQQVGGFMLKHGRIFPRTRAWTMRYLRWLQEQKFDHPPQMTEPARQFRLPAHLCPVSVTLGAAKWALVVT
jgi:hypothetical protein